ncbi:hypothetical protein ACHQM5_016002 [Ranunculus cassubicifolius]
MGRGKIEIKRIENSTNRQVTFSKRRNGILKKAKEIAILCEAKVSLVIFTSNSKMFEFNSHPLAEILHKYQKDTGNKLWDAKHEFLHQECARIKKENESMQRELGHLKGEDINSLQPGELIPIEQALENGITRVKERKMEIYRMMRRNDKLLEEENKLLVLKLQQMMNGNGREHPSQMPFTFRVQPAQPNLQDN